MGDSEGEVVGLPLDGGDVGSPVGALLGSLDGREVGSSVTNAPFPPLVVDADASDAAASHPCFSQQSSSDSNK